VELKPGGRSIAVTDENKHEYVTLVTKFMLTDSIRPQIDAFLQGLHELIPADLLSIFQDQELELLICGLPDIDLDDLRANTEYRGFRESDREIQWFWQIAYDLDQEGKALLIQFVTGTSKVPIHGFRDLQGMHGTQRFQICKVGGVDRLPSAHTCFNQIDLPSYSSLKVMQEKLLFAIREGSQGFGFQ
jgi:E3 ubiquitin-protein ligase HUWE1